MKTKRTAETEKQWAKDEKKLVTAFNKFSGKYGNAIDGFILCRNKTKL